MADTHHITDMVPRMREGDDEAADVLWQEFFSRLVGYARRKLDGLSRAATGEEDVALSAMFSFCRGMEEGRFDKVEDREGLWKLLVTITARKACATRRKAYAAKRDARQTQHEGSILWFESWEESGGGLDQLAVAPSEEMADQVVDNCHRLLDCLDEKSRQVALWTLEGYSTSEIAAKLGCVRRTVERKLERIREKWIGLGVAPKSQ
ncbi:MAG: ECF-type sigma factor [Planctomycetota bacterium]